MKKVVIEFSGRSPHTIEGVVNIIKEEHWLEFVGSNASYTIPAANVRSFTTFEAVVQQPPVPQSIEPVIIEDVEVLEAEVVDAPRRGRK